MPCASGRLRRANAPRGDIPDFDTVLAEVGGWSAALRGSDVAEQREVVAALVERVVPVRLGHSTYEARITWTPMGEALRATLETVAVAEGVPIAVGQKTSPRTRLT
ncbi:MAG TPA: hypothetical protein VIO35_01710 [Chloroflexota bacterium]